MKIETAKVVSQAKMVKSDVWISKKQVSAIFNFEKSFSMNCMTEGFRKCGIYPFDPNAVDKPLLLRTSTNADPSSIDLATQPQESGEEKVSCTTDDSHDVAEVSYSSRVKDLDQVLLDESFTVGDDGILTLEPADVATSTSPDIEMSPADITCPRDNGY
ncbi:LOW QUALITY PROTEIN: hypothetical protein MAR_006365 [Mya arenaria]|uniref:Uncharacterized protein n=1 Tax=Mya arenaria TaxID=6604 RepID=A0ABY7D945_MYAAR|nr:LOW QUALITY PROTEIN: hypothetical protein MAR_006365 [Mya arenaria]